MLEALAAPLPVQTHWRIGGMGHLDGSMLECLVLGLHFHRVVQHVDVLHFHTVVPHVDTMTIHEVDLGWSRKMGEVDTGLDVHQSTFSDSISLTVPLQSI